jgi:dolichyl-phosphate beta-glucosyltransferase
MQRTKNLFLSIVIPAYNEEKRIERSLEKIYKYLSTQPFSYEVIISDDGSTDSTKEIVKRHQEDWIELELIENIHRGKAPAIIAGMKEANGKFVLFTDVDLSVSIEEVGKMLVWVEDQGYDIAIASREGPGSVRMNEPYMRHFMGRVFNFIVQLLVLRGINDTQCGFKLFRQMAAQQIFSQVRLYSDTSNEIVGAKVSGFDVEILFIAKKLGYKIKEVPVTWVYKDNSKVHNLKDSYYNFIDVIKVWSNGMRGLYHLPLSTPKSKSIENADSDDNNISTSETSSSQN